MAHRSAAELAAAGLELLLDTTARRIDVAGQRLHVTGPDGTGRWLPYDRLVIATGAVPVRPPIAGLDALGPGEGVHLLHTMGDTFTLTDDLTARSPRSALIVGAGYIGLEMAEALRTRGLAVTMVERLPQVLPTVDPDLGVLVAAELADHGVQVVTGTTVTAVTRSGGGLAVDGVGAGPSGVPAGRRPRPRRGRRPPRHRAGRRGRRGTRRGACDRGRHRDADQPAPRARCR